MKTTHLVRIAATHTACGKPRGDFAPTNITLIHGHASCLGCVVDISKRALETLTRIVRENTAKIADASITNARSKP